MKKNLFTLLCTILFFCITQMSFAESKVTWSPDPDDAKSDDLFYRLYCTEDKDDDSTGYIHFLEEDHNYIYVNELFAPLPITTDSCWLSLEVQNQFGNYSDRCGDPKNNCEPLLVQRGQVMNISFSLYIPQKSQ